MMTKFGGGPPNARPMPQDEPPEIKDVASVNISGGETIDEDTRRRLLVFLTRAVDRRPDA